MDTKWTKTDLPCDCGVLERAAECPDLPILFDERMNEFCFIYSNSQGAQGRLLIRHCFFCGGQAPASKRTSFFETLSAAERERLWALIRPMKTLADVFGAWGEPDREYPGGTESELPEKEGQAGVIQQFDTLEYARLSDTGIVRVMVYPDHHVAFALHGKPRNQDVPSGDLGNKRVQVDG